MAQNQPIARPDGMPVPAGAAAIPNAPVAIDAAEPVQGAIELEPAPAAKRIRLPRGPVAVSSSSSNNSAPILLELAAAHPMRTVQRRTPSQFIPDSQMLFHALSVCDRLMVSTERFTKSCPAWIPIVSQLYISLLWNTHILRVIVNAGYGEHFTTTLDLLIRILRLDECVIPGPLVPFFQAISAISGPYDWMGDVLPCYPLASQLWNPDTRGPRERYARFIPLPCIMLDQLLRYGNTAPVAGSNSNYASFLWYSNIFNSDVFAYSYSLGPQHCGSLYCSQALHDAARPYWTSNFENVARMSIEDNQPQPTTLLQLYGLVTPGNALQTDWLTLVTQIMQKYCQYFNGSVTLGSIPTAGMGSVAVYGRPIPTQSVSNWLYPVAATAYTGFASTRFAPRRPIPVSLSVNFCHADPHLDQADEQFATISHTNIIWSDVSNETELLTSLEDEELHIGDYWILYPHRENEGVSVLHQFTQITANRYHQLNNNRAE
ncbi:ORF1 [Ambrosia cryptic virus 2]|nr:ORF1 [Ambrosia cryptic virus 2]